MLRVFSVLWSRPSHVRTDVAPGSGVTFTVEVASPERQLWRQGAARAPPFPSAARSLN